MQRLALIVFSLLVVATGLILLLSRTPAMPTYNGHTADYWLDEIYARTTATSQSDAINAFRAMDKAALPFLLHNLESADTLQAAIHGYVYRHSANILGRFLPKPNYILHRSAAELVLMNITATSNAVPDLVKMAARTSGFTRQLTLNILLNRVQSDHPEYAPVFLPALSDTNASVRYVGVQLLTDIENRSSNVVSQVANLLNDPDDVVRTAAAYGVWKLSGDTNATIPVLIEELGKTKLNSFSPYYCNTTSDYRRLVVHHLFAVGGKSAAVTDFFRKQLKSPDRQARHEACVQLQWVGQSASFLADEVHPLLNDPDPWVREAALRAIHSISPARYLEAPL